TFPADARSPLKLSLVEASWDRVIRTTVGLRPHRDSHRAIDLSRCARSRLPLFWRPDHYSKVRYTPRFHVPAATDHHQLHRTRLANVIGGRRIGTAEGSAHAFRAPAGNQLSNDDRCS